MRNQRGEGAIKIIVSLAALFYAIFCGIRIASSKSDDKAMEKKMEEVLKFAGTKGSKLEEMEYDIGKLVQQYNIPVSIEEDVEVYEEDNMYHSELSYDRNVKLIFWTYTTPVKIHAKFTKY